WRPIWPEMNRIRLGLFTSIWWTYRPAGAWTVSGFRLVDMAGLLQECFELGQCLGQVGSAEADAGGGIAAPQGGRWEEQGSGRRAEARRERVRRCASGPVGVELREPRGAPPRSNPRERVSAPFEERVQHGQVRRDDLLAPRQHALPCPQPDQREHLRRCRRAD